MSLDATPAGPNANAYCDQTFATSYFGELLAIVSAPWTAASPADKDAAIITATRRLEEEEYQGFRATTTQALKWPRGNVWNPDKGGYYGFSVYDSTVVPDDMKRATCELALALVNDPNLLVWTGLEAFSTIPDPAGNPWSPRGGSQGMRLPPQCMRFLKYFLLGSAATELVRS